MNTTLHAAGTGVKLEPLFRRVEATLTRFDPESPLSQLNRMPERWVVVPPLLHLAIQKALEAAHLTGGAFDPTIFPALESAGYGRSFELGPTQPGPARPAGRWREVKLGPGVVWLQTGIELDLGGIGKGLAVDLAMRKVRRAHRSGTVGRGEGVLIDAGGDIGLWTPPGAAPWVVEVADPFAPDRPLTAASLHAGAVATSSTLGRRWGEGLHHIIDPRTGRPSQSPIVSATVFATSVARAEVLAKASIVLGPDRALALLSAQHCHGLMVTVSGEQILTPGLEEFLYADAE